MSLLSLLIDLKHPDPKLLNGSLLDNCVECFFFSISKIYRLRTMKISKIESKSTNKRNTSGYSNVNYMNEKVPN